jgi:rubredoxin
MQAYECTVCGYLYDEQSAERDAEGNLLEFQNLDTDWVCPICGVRQDLFKVTESNRIPDVSISKK